MIDRHHGWNISFKPVILGFILSLVLIAAMHRIAIRHHLEGTLFLLTVFGLAAAQAIIQLVFFFQVGLESKPRWSLVTFLFMVLVIFVIIGGSIWIMDNLNYNVMPPMGH